MMILLHGVGGLRLRVGGMVKLVTRCNQVKFRYTEAIVKLHPGNFKLKVRGSLAFNQGELLVSF
jgi:hypothetical protein